MTITLPGRTGASVYVLKYNTSGNPIWATSFAHTTSTGGSNVVATYSTDVYIAGYSALSNVSLSNADGTFPTPSVTTPSVAVNHVYLAKYDTNGNVKWIISPIRASSQDLAYSLAIDSTGVYLAGRYNNATDPLYLKTASGGTSTVTLPTTSNVDAFLVKHDVDGNPIWAASVQDDAGGQGNAVATYSTDVYFSGSYNAGSSFVLSNANGIASSITLPSTLVADAFLVKYNTSGDVQWAASIQGSGPDNGQSLATDSTGVYMAGVYYNASSISLSNAGGGAPTPSVTLQSSSSANCAYIAKYDTNGVVKWAISIKGNSTSACYAVAVGSQGVYATGTYVSTSQTTLSNGDGSTSAIALPANGYCYIIKCDTSGTISWVRTFGGSATSVTGYSVSLDSTGVYVTGQYIAGSNLSILDAAGSTARTLQNGSGAFYVKYNHDGVVQWAAATPTTGITTTRGCSADSTGVYFSGYYTSTDPVPVNPGV